MRLLYPGQALIQALEGKGEAGLSMPMQCRMVALSSLRCTGSRVML